MRAEFEWDIHKERLNIQKHGIDFSFAARVFIDPDRKIYIDEKHSIKEQRFFCIGLVCGKVMTVRFLYRGAVIRIIGAGYWRKGKSYYEKEG